MRPLANEAMVRYLSAMHSQLIVGLVAVQHPWGDEARPAIAGGLRMHAQPR